MKFSNCVAIIPILPNLENHSSHYFFEGHNCKKQDILFAFISIYIFNNLFTLNTKLQVTQSSIVHGEVTVSDVLKYITPFLAIVTLSKNLLRLLIKLISFMKYFCMDGYRMVLEMD